MSGRPHTATGNPPPQAFAKPCRMRRHRVSETTQRSQSAPLWIPAYAGKTITQRSP